jgi:hypothetical protein
VITLVEVSSLLLLTFVVPKGGEEPELIERMRKINNKCLDLIYAPINSPTDTHLSYIEYSLPEPI